MFYENVILSQFLRKENVFFFLFLSSVFSFFLENMISFSKIVVKRNPQNQTYLGVFILFKVFVT